MPRPWLCICGLLVWLVASVAWAQGLTSMLTFAAVGPDGVSSIYLVRADGRGVQHVVADGRDPSFTADGRIVFARGQDVYAVAQNGANLTPLTRNGADITVSDPVLSEDGSLLLYTAAPVIPNPVTHIVLHNMDGSGQRTLAANATDPTFTPDQVQIIYAGQGALYSMSRNSMGGPAYTPRVMWQPLAPMQLRDPAMGTGHFKGFIFAGMPTRGARNRWHIVAVHDTETGTVTTLLATHANQPAISPDGTMIAFVRNGDLYTMKANGRAEMPIVQGMGRISHPDWREQ